MRISSPGGATAAQVWSNATRTLSAFAAQDLFVYPAKDSWYTLIAVTSGGVDTAGSWAQFSADIGAGKVLV
jgi:hypothetical protein